MPSDSAVPYSARRPRRLAHGRACAVEWLEPRALCAAILADPTPVAWFRADAIAAPAGAPVASWTDSSGHLRTATQPDPARRPRFVPDGLNGRPAVHFDAAASTQLAFTRPVSGDFTLVVAFGSRQGIGHGTDWYGAAGLVDGEVAGVTSDFGLSLNAFGQVIGGTGAPDTSLASDMGFNDGRAHVATFTRNTVAGITSLYVDGRLSRQATAGTQPLTAPSRLTIGSTQTNINYFTGDIGEVRVYGAALPDATRAAIESDLTSRYNVAPLPGEVFSNPVINRDFPDPGVVYAGGNYYAFATNGSGRNVQAARSTDLVHWATLPDALPYLPSWAQAGRTWAPDVAVMASGTYNLYYTATNRATGRQAIGVATSASPSAQFVPTGAAPLVTQTSQGGAIDPSVFTDADGARYLLWKNDGNAVGQDTNIYIQRLSADGLGLTGTPTALIHQDRAWEGNLVEGPVMWAQGGKYYLFYCANNFASGAYSTGYAVSTSLRGPYVKPAGPILQTEGAVVGPGGPEIVTGPDGNVWMLYHSWENDFGFRSMSIDRLDWDGDVPVLRGPSRAIQPVPVPPRVLGRYAFYNDSAFDGGNAGADARDDAAIATDKRPLLPGQTATFGNVTSYTRGINGIMLDVSGLPLATAALPASSFVVQVAGGAGAATWAPGPAPSGVAIRRGQGTGGSDRITLTWPEGAIRNAWVRITVPTTAQTALAAPDVFAFGNLVGDAGNRATAGALARVDALDLVAVRRNLFSTASVTSPYDFDRDGRVTALDLAAARANLSRSLPATALLA